MTVCGRCARRDGGDEDAARDTRELAWREFAGTLGQWRTGAVRLGVESLAAGRGRGCTAPPKASAGEDAESTCVPSG